MGKSKQTTTSGPSKWQMQSVTPALNSVNSVYDANKQPIADISGGVQSLFPGLLSDYQAGDANLNEARDYGSDVLGGKFLGENPFAKSFDGFSANPNINPNGFLDSIINQTNNDVTDRTKAGFGSRGSFGGTAYIKSLSDSLAKNENNLRYTEADKVRGMQVDDFNRIQSGQANDFGQVRALNSANYATERNNQEAAASRVPGLMSADNARLAPLLSAGEAGTQMPFAGVNNYADLIARLVNMNGETTTKQSGGLFQSLLGAGSSLGSAAILASDRALKSNIRKVGEFVDGLGWYEYDIFGSRTEGVMADEIERLRPWALGPKINGYASVNYGAI